MKYLIRNQLMVENLISAYEQRKPFVAFIESCYPTKELLILLAAGLFNTYRDLFLSSNNLELFSDLEVRLVFKDNTNKKDFENINSIVDYSKVNSYVQVRTIENKNAIRYFLSTSHTYVGASFYTSFEPLGDELNNRKKSSCEECGLCLCRADTILLPFSILEHAQFLETGIYIQNNFHHLLH